MNLLAVINMLVFSGIRFMRFCLFFIILAFVTLEAGAREPVNSLDISFGMGHVSRQDLVFSPFIHSGFSAANFGLRYQRDKKFYQQSRLFYSGFSSGIQKPYTFYVNNESQNSIPNSYTLVHIYHGLGKQVHEVKNCRTIAGIYVNMDVQALNYQYGRISSFGYYSNTGIGFSYRGIYTPAAKHHIAVGVDLPLFSWLARSPYLVNDDEFIENISSHRGFKTFMSFIGDGKLVTWNRVQTINTTVEYNWMISEKWYLGANYRFAFIHSSLPRSFISFQNNLDLVAGLKF